MIMEYLIVLIFVFPFGLAIGAFVNFMLKKIDTKTPMFIMLGFLLLVPAVIVLFAYLQFYMPALFLAGHAVFVQIFLFFALLMGGFFLLIGNRRSQYLNKISLPILSVIVLLSSVFYFSN